MRALLLELLYEWSKVPYQKYAKQNNPWSISIRELTNYPKNSLGFHLASFLARHSFEIQPKLESHDVFHVLTGTGVSVPEEISMQFFLLGNGKRSLYLFTVVVIGTLLYPDFLLSFRKAYLRGKEAWSFHHLDFSKLLHQPISHIQNIFLIR